MKTKLKDIILYSLAIVGAVSLFINAKSNLQETTSTVPESHVWEMYSSLNSAFSINKVTGEVRKYNVSNPMVGKDGVLDSKSVSSYSVMVERKPKQYK